MIYHRFHPKSEIASFLSGKYRSYEPADSFSADVEYDLQRLGVDQDEIDVMNERERWIRFFDLTGRLYDDIVWVATRGSKIKDWHVKLPGVFAYPGKGEGEYSIRPSSSDDYLIEFEGRDTGYVSIENEAVATVDKIISIKEYKGGKWVRVPTLLKSTSKNLKSTSVVKRTWTRKQSR